MQETISTNIQRLVRRIIDGQEGTLRSSTLISISGGSNMEPKKKVSSVSFDWSSVLRRAIRNLLRKSDLLGETTGIDERKRLKSWP